jgi:Rod binding domain-containing protein
MRQTAFTRGTVFHEGTDTMPDIISGLTSLPEVRSVSDDGNQSKIQNPKSKIEKLRNATREMEGYFVGVLLKKMHESASKGGLFDQRSESATYREMFDEAVAGEIGRRGAFGIADTLFRELWATLSVSDDSDQSQTDVPEGESRP